MSEKYRNVFTGHARNARKAVVKLGLATEKEITYLSDDEVAKLINKSGNLILETHDDWVLVPKEYEDKLIWVCR